MRYGHSSQHTNSQNIPVVHSQVDDHLRLTVNDEVMEFPGEMVGV